MPDLKLSEKELKEFVERAKRWRKGDHEDLQEYINDQRLLYFQVLGKIGQHPPDSRSGPRNQISAIREWAKIAFELERAIGVKHEREKGR